MATLVTPSQSRTNMWSRVLAAFLGLAGASGCDADERGGGGGGPASGDPKGKADGLFGGDDVVYADVFNSVSSVDRVVLRGRIVEVEPDEIGDLAATPISQVKQADLEHERVSLRLRTADETFDLGEVETDAEGYLDVTFDVSELGLDPGEATVEIRHEGVPVGTSRVVLVADDRTQPVVRSDIDLTYLDPSLHGAVDLATLMTQDAFDRRTLPAMDLLLQRLRHGDEHPLSFLSASPSFFKRTLEAKMALDEVEQDGMRLKPFRDVITTTLQNFDFGSIVSDLQEQVGYKLSSMLRARLELPATTPEVLLGDDAEADFVVYNLYARLLSGEIDLATLDQALVDLGVSDDWQAEIDAVVPEVLAMHAAPPAAIYINATSSPSTSHAVEDWQLDTLHHHDGAWPLALDLFEERLLSEDDVLDVRERLLSLGQTPAELDAAAAAADFLDPDTRTKFAPG